MITTSAQCWLHSKLASYLCIGITKLTGKFASPPPPPFVSQGRLSRVWPARLLLPAFLLSSPGSLSTFSHFTHLQPGELLTEMRSQAQLSQQHPLRYTRRQAFKTSSSKAAWCLGTTNPTCLPNSISGMESTTTEETPVTEGLPKEANGIGDSRKIDRDGNMLITG